MQGIFEELLKLIFAKPKNENHSNQAKLRSYEILLDSCVQIPWWELLNKSSSDDDNSKNNENDEYDYTYDVSNSPIF